MVRKKILDQALGVFERKIDEYGVSFGVLRPKTLTDQILIKAYRIRTIQDRGGLQHVSDESLSDSYIGVLNYALIYLIKEELGEKEDLSSEVVLDSYHQQVAKIEEIYEKKNSDYGAAWKLMRDESFIDMILQKLQRIRQLEDTGTQGSGIIDSYQDIVNYAIFALIRLSEEP